MNKEEAIKALEDSGIDYEVTAEHEDGFQSLLRI